jgi:hypothetical protein
LDGDEIIDVVFVVHWACCCSFDICFICNFIEHSIACNCIDFDVLFAMIIISCLEHHLPSSSAYRPTITNIEDNGCSITF